MVLRSPIINKNTTYTLLPDQLKELEAVKSRQIDTSVIPELTADEAEKLHFKYYKPVKEPVQLRIDADVRNKKP
jgi:uncharacterized protein (DUF4415 family)